MVRKISSRWQAPKQLAALQSRKPWIPSLNVAPVLRRLLRKPKFQNTERNILVSLTHFCSCGYAFRSLL
ncbi:hypothetical protein IEQ34_019357 [Dendrobium chrysotoxum]|uniref:Uncharacterized protein n=1 Tax=Dendrobium chrysotoxum TaxID=161865 RepID=A0AAV7G9R4_DENCH|nr:hypothetical protein IEQ34_019357 [Dendrobium chrysotoxum]